MRGIKRFQLSYFIFLTVCILLSGIFLIYVSFVVKEFDRSQPARTVERYIEGLAAMGRDNTVVDKLKITELCYNRYEDNNGDEYSEKYAEKIRSGKLTYEYDAANSTELSKTYRILSDKKSVGNLKLSGDNCRNKLFFFSMADWSVDAFEPIVADTVYNLTLYVPEGTNAFINGWQLSPGELDEKLSGDIPVYSVKGLLHQPEISYKDSSGEEIPFTSEQNVIKPIVFDYSFSVPSGITVKLGNEKLSGEKDADGDMRYVIRSMVKPEVTFTDVLGEVKAYDPEDEAGLFRCDVALPDDYSLTVAGRNADEVCEPQVKPNPDAAVMLEQAGVALPDRKTYSLAFVNPGAEAVVTNANGVSKSYALDKKRLEINSLSGDIPEDISAQINPLEIAKNWSKFMTNDYNHLDVIQSYFIKDSDYYHYAYQWAYGIDHTFTSEHIIDSFTNESVNNFVRYSDTCFSCEVYFEKNMTLYRGERWVGKKVDVFNSIMYFVYIDDTPNNGLDDPHWAIAVMHDIV